MRPVPIAVPETGEEEVEAVREVLASGWLTQGPKVEAFEAAFAARASTDFGLTTTSCTTAMHLVLAALDVGPGDEVIVPAFTWVATANVVAQCGATPVFADVSPETYNLTPETVESAISERTRAALGVHLFGLISDIDDVIAVLGPDIALVEDAACAVGASMRDRPAGSLGIAGCFSFHPRKIITTGEGGMVTTSDAELARRMAALRSHGAEVSEEARHRGSAPWQLPDFSEQGFNYRMTDLQAAIGLAQLDKLDHLLAVRRRLAAEYEAQLAGVEWIRTPSVPDGSTHGWQAYVIRLAADSPVTQAEMLERLCDIGIAARPGTVCVPATKVYRRLGADPDRYPESVRLAQSTVALPIHSRMSERDLQHIVESVVSLAAR